MKRAIFVAGLLLFTSLFAYGDGEPKQNILIRKGFKSQNAYLIVCKGFPKEGVEGISRRETAKEAALINAQMIARDVFNETVDPVRNGIAKKFVVYDDYAIVYYEITKSNLKKRLRKSTKRK
jgi:hypothetical protein